MLSAFRVFWKVKQRKKCKLKRQILQARTLHSVSVQMKITFTELIIGDNLSANDQDLMKFL